MSWILSVLLIVQVISALSIVVLVLLQQGKGADMGSAFGGGGAGSLFGAAGAANFLSRATKWAAVVFFCTTGGLAYLSHSGNASGPAPAGVMEGFEQPDHSIPQVPGAGDASVPSVPNGADVPTPPPAPADVPAPAPADVPTPAPEAAPQPEASPAPAEPAVPAAPEAGQAQPETQAEQPEPTQSQ